MRRPKRPKLNVNISELLHTGKISLTGLASLLHKLNVSEELSEERIRHVLMDANHAILDECGDDINIPLTNGTEFNLAIADVCKYFAKLVESSPAVAQVYGEAVRRYPPGVDSPWHLVIGYDEFIPGNKLSVEHSRKTMVINATFTELGQAAMSDSIYWCTICVIRSTVIKQVRNVTSHSWIPVRTHIVHSLQ